MASALRRSEFVALTVSDLTRTPCGMDVRVARSKTDPTGRAGVLWSLCRRGGASARWLTCSPGSRAPASPPANFAVPDLFTAC